VIDRICDSGVGMVAVVEYPWIMITRWKKRKAGHAYGVELPGWRSREVGGVRAECRRAGQCTMGMRLREQLVHTSAVKHQPVEPNPDPFPPLI
jgi:hypothetical protein